MADFAALGQMLKHTNICCTAVTHRHRIISIPLPPLLHPSAHCHSLLFFPSFSLICIIHSLLLKLKMHVHTHTHRTDRWYHCLQTRCRAENVRGMKGRRECPGKINTYIHKHTYICIHNNTIIILGTGLGTNLGKTPVCQLTAPDDLPKPAGEEHTVSHTHMHTHRLNYAETCVRTRGQYRRKKILCTQTK